MLISGIPIVMCSENEPSTGTADTTDTGIALEGKVLTQNNIGISGIVAKIAHTNFTDTTDNNGFYSINISTDSLAKTGIDLNNSSDTLQLLQGSSLIKSITINEWVDSLPDVYLVQRSINGTLLGDISKIQKNTIAATKDLPGVSQSDLELDAQIKFIDGMSSSDIQDALIKTAVEKIDIDVPNWTFVASLA